MGLLRYARNANYKRFYNDLKELSPKTGKPAWLMFADAGLCFALYRSGLQDYLNFKFYNKSFAERKTYVTTGDEYHAYKILANPANDVFADKTNLFRRLGHLAKRDFCDPREGYEGFKAFIEKHESFVRKPIIGLGGSRVERVETAEIGDPHAYYEDLLENRDFVEELIVQDPTWASLSPGSVNTLRIMTFCIDGNARILFACARVGSGSSIVDNFHQGGMGLLVDMERGCLSGNGFTKKLEESEVSVTGVRFDGFPIPYWDEVKAMIIEGAIATPEVYFIGWDIAIGVDGPLVVEANCGSGWDITQVVAQRPSRHHVARGAFFCMRSTRHKS